MKEIRSFSCDVEGCVRKEMVEVTCLDCGGVFCLQHRHQLEHSCSSEPPKKFQHQRPKTKSTPASAGGGGAGAGQTGLAAKSAAWSSSKGDKGMAGKGEGSEVELWLTLGFTYIDLCMLAFNQASRCSILVVSIPIFL